MFVTSFDSYLVQQDDDQITLDMKKIATGHLNVAGTKDVMDIVNIKASISRELLPELITNDTTKYTKTLEKDICALKKVINPLKVVQTCHLNNNPLFSGFSTPFVR